MTFGISRVHGAAGTPSQRPSTVSHYTLTAWSTQNFASSATTATVFTGTPNTPGTASDIGVVNGALDQIFRTAIGTVATVAMVGTPSTTLRFAIEDTGVDSNSVGYLGQGLIAGATGYTTTALALQGAIQALGTVNGLALGSYTVAAYTY